MRTDIEQREGYTKERELKADGRYVIYYTFTEGPGTAQSASGTEPIELGEGQGKAEEGADV